MSLRWKLFFWPLLAMILSAVLTEGLFDGDPVVAMVVGYVLWWTVAAALAKSKHRCFREKSHVGRTDGA